jgi:hypothetical protein
VADNLQLKLLIGTDGAASTVAQLAALQKQIEATAATSPGITRLANTMGTSYAEAEKFAKGLGMTGEAATQAIGSLRSLNAVGADSFTKFSTLAAQGKITAEQFGALDKAAQANRGSQAQLSEGLGMVAFKFNNIIQALQTLRAVAQPVYDALIASNEKLNAQLLSSQTNLASSSRIFQGGAEITDPTAKINATKGQLRAALKQIEADTQSLVGVTSEQVNELFQITLTNAASLNNQSKQFPDAISAATSLTKGWAASLKVVGIPLNQARQEINSIVKGQVDQNSLLAKNLNITNDQVNQWKAQGRLVDELNKRLNVFVAGNAIAARSIEGIGSNITDLIQRMGRISGEPLLEPIINVLDQIEKYLKKNETAITNFFRGFSETGAGAIESLKQFEPTFKAIEDAIAQLAPIVQTLFKAATDGSVLVGRAIQENLKPALALLQIALEGYGKLNDLINYRGDSDAISALEVYGEALGNLQQRIIQNGAALKRLQEIEANGGTLTAEQVAQRKQLLSVGKALSEQAQAEAKEIGKLQANNPAIIEYRNNLVKQAEAQQAASEKNAGALRTEANLVEDLGTTQELYAKRVKQARDLISKDGNGDPAQLKAAMTESIKLAESGVKSRLTSIEAARDELEAIRSNTKAELEIRTQAKDAINSLDDARIAKVKELIEVGTGTNQSAIDELEKIKNDAGLEASTRKKAADQIVAITKARIAAETAAIAAQSAEVAQLKANERISEVEADKRTTQLKLAELTKQAEAQQAAVNNAVSEQARQQAISELEKTEAAKLQLIGEYQQRERRAILESYDSKRQLLSSQRELGLTSEREYQDRLLVNNAAQLDTQLAQQRQSLAKLADGDKAGREKLLGQIGEVEAKRAQLIKAYDQKAIELENTRYDQQLKAFEAYKATSQISEAEFAQLRLKNSLEQADREIELQQFALSRLGKNDAEGRAAIEAKILELRTRRIAAFDQLYQAELEQIKIYQAKAGQLLQQAEVERNQQIQSAANSQISTLEKTEQAKLDLQRGSLSQQLATAKDAEAKLAALAGKSRSPEAERAYQNEVRAARLATSQITLRQLELEGQQIQLNRTRAIQAIEEEQAARSRSADAQLGQITAVSAAQARASKAAESGYSAQQNKLDNLSRSLDRQNSLFQAQVGLAKALEGAADAQGNIEAEKVKSAIELTKQLQEGNLSDRQRIEIQDRLNQLVGSNTQTIAQLTARQSQIEQDTAQRKAAALNLEQSIARQNLLIDQNKNDLANKRLLIEAQIAELKAKQAVLDAQAALQAQRINDQRAITAGQADVDRAAALAPGRDRDRAVADAQSKLALARQSASTNQANAQQAVELANQQVGFASQAVQQAKEQIAQQGIINQLQRQTLEITQATARSTYDAAEAMRQYAAAAERARAAAAGISAPVPARSAIPAIAIPQIGNGVAQPVGDGGISAFNSQQIEQAVRDLQRSIESRPAGKIEVPVSINRPKTEQDLEEILRVQRAAGRASL